MFSELLLVEKSMNSAHPLLFYLDYMYLKNKNRVDVRSPVIVLAEMAGSRGLYIALVIINFHSVISRDYWGKSLSTRDAVYPR